MSVTKHQWSVPGNRIKNYVATTSSATVTELKANDLNKAGVDYYWVDGSDGREVTYTATVDSKTFTGKTTFNVKKPTSTLSAEIGFVKVFKSTRGWALALVKANSSGITFAASFSEPSGFKNGTGQFWQVILNTSVNFTGGNYQNISKTGVLDGDGLPYENLPNAVDNPYVILPDACTMVSRQDSFKMWVMYKPFESDSIWVPLRSVQWYWNGVAEREGVKDDWKLISGSQGAQGSVSTSIFPEW